MLKKLNVSMLVTLGVAWIVIGLALYGAMYSTELGAKNDDIIIFNKSNTINLNTVIEGSSAKGIQKQLLDMDHTLRQGKPIFMYLNSPGGSITDGNSIIETAQGISRPVHTVSNFSASMSFIISQMLGTRYVMSSSTLMSHHASVSGLSGDVNGALNQRFLSLLAEIGRIDVAVAKRAKMDVTKYRDMITHEMWLNGDDSVTNGFADKVVKVTCDKSLDGVSEPQQVQIFGFVLEITYYNCPLIQYPASIRLGENNISKPDSNMWNKIIVELTDKKDFVNQYGDILTK